MLKHCFNAVRKELRKDCLPDTIWQRIKRLLNSNVAFKSCAKASSSVNVFGSSVSLEVEATLQENPDFRKGLNLFAQSSTSFYAEAATFAQDVARIIQAKTGCEKIVLVVDSLERPCPTALAQSSHSGGGLLRVRFTGTSPLGHARLCAAAHNGGAAYNVC